MKARSVPTAALVTIGVLTVASCGSTSDPGGNSSGDYAKDGSFTTIVNTDPGNLHPPLITNLTATQAINSYTNDSLLAIDPQNPRSGLVSGRKMERERNFAELHPQKGGSRVKTARPSLPRQRQTTSTGSSTRPTARRGWEHPYPKLR